MKAVGEFIHEKREAVGWRTVTNGSFASAFADDRLSVLSSGNVMVSFRPVRPLQDIEPLARLWNVTQHAVYDDRADLFDFAATRVYLKTVLLALHDVWVATVRDKQIGFIAKRSSRISQLHIAPRWQGRGIGKHLIRIAKARSSGKLTLACYREKVGKFYTAQGFREYRTIERRHGGAYVEYRWQTKRKGTPKHKTTP